VGKSCCVFNREVFDALVSLQNERKKLKLKLVGQVIKNLTSNSSRDYDWTFFTLLPVFKSDANELTNKKFNLFIPILLNVKGKSWVLVAHTCNPSYAGGRDQSQPRQIVHNTLF
jgi:hypothetical protein